MSKPKRYHKKPVIVEAMEWTGVNINDLWDWMGAADLYGPVPAQKRVPENSSGMSCPAVAATPAKLYDKRRDVWIPLIVGDWLVKDVTGINIVHASAFKRIYEREDWE